MAHVQSNNPRTELRRLIPTANLEALSLDAQFMLRERKLDLKAFLWTLVFGGGAGGKPSRTSFHDTYLSVASRSMNESSFDAWLRKPELEPWLRSIVEHVMKQLESGTSEADARLAGGLAQFGELFCADMTPRAKTNASSRSGSTSRPSCSLTAHSRGCRCSSTRLMIPPTGGHLPSILETARSPWLPGGQSGRVAPRMLESMCPKLLSSVEVDPQVVLSSQD